MTSSRTKTIGLTLAALCLGTAAICNASQAAPVALEMKEQPLSTALREFARQTGIQIAIQSELADGRTAPGLTGKYEPAVALAALLEGTGLIAYPVNENTYGIRPAGRKPIAGVSQVDTTIRLAQGAADPSQGMQAVQPSPSEGEGQGEDKNNTDKTESESARRGIPEILVRGSKSLNLDIQRTRDDALPYVIFSAEEIEKSGASNLEDFFRKRLPMNTQQKINNQTNGNAGETAASNVSQINLRGLGVLQTLILVDGRRAPRVLGPSDSGGYTFSQADVNGIPLAAIERIEILPSTAGGIYGGGAVGGVINIVRKKDYKGLDVRAGYEGAFRGGAEMARLELSAGFTIAGIEVSVSASQANSQPLYAGDNDLAQRARNRLLALHGVLGSLSGGLVPFRGFTPNILAVPVFDGSDYPNCYVPERDFCTTPQNLSLKPIYGGTELNSPATYVPVGYSGVNSDSGLALVENAGRYNTEPSSDYYGRRAPLINNPRIQTAAISLRKPITSRLQTYVDFSYGSDEGRVDVPSIQTNFLPSAAANNPFQQDIYIAFPQGILTSATSRTASLATTAGSIFELGADWSSTLEYQWSRARTRGAFSFEPLGNALSSPLIDAYQNNPDYDPVRDTNVFTFDYRPFRNPQSPDSVDGPRDSIQKLLSLRASGPIATLAGGPMTLTTALEHRAEHMLGAFSRNPYAVNYFASQNQSNDSVYVEVAVPLVSDLNSLSGVQALDMQVSIRHDRYKTKVSDPFVWIRPAGSTDIINGNTGEPFSGFDYQTAHIDSTNFTLAAKWTPVSFLAARLSFTTGFLPPNTTQLVPVTVPGQVGGYRDPKRGYQFVGEESSFVNSFGGNAHLTPEDSKSFSAGVILTPSSLAGWRVSIDYTSVEKTDEIGYAPSDISVLEQYFPDRVVRAPLTALDETRGYTGGVITQIDATLLNVAKAKVRAWDFQLDYNGPAVSWGQVHAYAIATHQTALARQLLPTSPEYDTVDYSDGPLKWRSNAGLDWIRGRLSAHWNAQWYHSYSIRSGAFPEASDLNVAIQGAERIPSQIYHDVGFSYKWESGGLPWLDQLRFALGIQNIFDARPPVLATTGAIATFSPYGDPRLRRYTLTISKSFN